MKRIIVTAFLWGMFQTAHATPMTWSLDNVFFNDGATAGGSFTYDEATNSVSDWNISVSGGNESVFPAFTYDPTSTQSVGVYEADSTGLSFQFFVDPNATGGTPESRVIVLTTEGFLTDIGATIPLNITSILWQSRECYNCDPYRLVSSGSLVSVSAPSTFLTLLTGLAILSLYLRWSSRKNQYQLELH